MDRVCRCEQEGEIAGMPQAQHVSSSSLHGIVAQSARLKRLTKVEGIHWQLFAIEEDSLSHNRPGSEHMPVGGRVRVTGASDSEGKNKSPTYL